MITKLHMEELVGRNCLLLWRFLMVAFKRFFKSRTYMSQIPQCLRTVFVVFLPTQNRVGKALKSADEVKKPTGFQITLLDCICFEVLFSAVIILHVLDHTNKALEESLKKSHGLHEIQINLWYTRCLLLCGKEICSACLHFFRIEKENAVSFDTSKLPQNGILRTKLEGPFPHFAWSALWQKKWHEISKQSASNSPWDSVRLGWHSLDYFILYLANLSLCWKKVCKSYCFFTFGPSLEVLKYNS